MADEHDGNGDNVVSFTEKRVGPRRNAPAGRRQEDMSEYLKMLLHDLRDRVKELEERDREHHGKMNHWAGQRAVIVAVASTALAIGLAVGKYLLD